MRGLAIVNETQIVFTLLDVARAEPVCISTFIKLKPVKVFNLCFPRPYVTVYRNFIVDYVMKLFD